jgi:low affinity Fe/Cu permease
MEIIGIISLIIGLALVGLVIYLYVYTFKNVARINTSILEIKSKIGSMIRDINETNKKEFTLEMEQQQSINNIVSRLS